MKLVAIGIASALVLLVAPSAPAQTDSSAQAGQPTAASRKKARTHFQRGKALQEAGSYDKAIAEYEAAFTLVPDPAFVFNIARSLHLAGRTDEALVKYREYVAVRPEGEIAAEARDFIAEIERAQATRAAEEKAHGEEVAREKEQAEAAERTRQEEASRSEASEARSRTLAPPVEAGQRIDAERPSAGHGTAWRVGWISAGVGLVAGGVVIDVVPEGGKNGTLEAVDFAPVALYLAGVAAVALGLEVF
jgi:tetratricopeptide (TPR) repeat protein